MVMGTASGRIGFGAAVVCFPDIPDCGGLPNFIRSGRRSAYGWEIAKPGQPRRARLPSATRNRNLSLRARLSLSATVYMAMSAATPAAINPYRSSVSFRWLTATTIGGSAPRAGADVAGGGLHKGGSPRASQPI